MQEVRLNETQYKTRTKVRNVLFDEQPREKLANYGPEVLSDAELLAIFIRTGTTEMNVIETARDLIQKCGNIGRLARLDWQELSRIKGIGKVKALTLVAAFELARRLESGIHEDGHVLQSPQEVYKFFGPRLRYLDKEVFIVGYLNLGKQLIGFDKISTGGSNATIVDVSEIFRMALLNRASSLLLVHNHPSGNPNPSNADVQLTKRICETGRLLAVKIVDHIIIHGKSFYSFAENGLLNK